MTTANVTRQPTLVSALWPEARSGTASRQCILAVAGSLLVAACAQVEVPLLPVPITGQTFGVLVVGMALGSRLGALSLLLYLLEGLAGLPVFAGFGAGPAVMAGPTGGYLVGFVPAAWATGALAERGWDRSVMRTASAMAIGNLLLYLPGLAWLTVHLGGSLRAALAAGLAPFVIGDAMKLVVAAVALPSVWSFVGRRSRRRRP